MLITQTLSLTKSVLPNRKFSNTRPRTGRLKDIQETQPKDQHDSNLLPPGQMQHRPHRHGQDHDPQISHNLQRSVEKPHGRLGQTAIQTARAPEIRDGDAEQHGAHYHPQAQDRNDHQTDDHDDTVARCWEETQVEQEHRDLGAGEGDVVEDDGEVEGFQLAGDLGDGEGRLGLAQAVVYL